MSEDPIPEAEIIEERTKAPAENPPAAPENRKSRSWRLPLFLIGVSALAIGAAWFDPMNWKGESSLPAVQQEVTALGNALEKAKAAQSGLEARLAALESQQAALSVTSESVAQLDRRLASVEDALQALSEAPASADGSIPAASFAALQAAVQGLKTDLAALGSAPGAVPAEAVQAAVDAAMADWLENEASRAQAEIEAQRSDAAKSTAVEAIRAALFTGAPFAEALPALAGIDIPVVLKDHADKGLPTLNGLSADFPESARKALDASLRAMPEDTSLTGRLLGFLRVQSGARSLEPREGTDPDAVLSRAEAAMKAGDVASAVKEIAGLPPEGLAEMAAWSAQADLYILADKAIADLSAAVGP